jgi:hypothetical protein
MGFTTSVETDKINVIIHSGMVITYLFMIWDFAFWLSVFCYQFCLTKKSFDKTQTHVTCGSDKQSHITSTFKKKLN